MPIVAEFLERFAPISLKEMDSVQLLDRIDTKYVFGEALLPALYDAMRDEYRVLVVNGRRGADYRTLYYDTPGIRHFKDHHQGLTLRSKVRYREYVGSDLYFLEVKQKTGRGRTNKVRMRVSGIPLEMPEEHLDFVRDACKVKEPHYAQLWNSFRRTTFVHRDRPERLTVDTGLRFERNGQVAYMGPACVVELKQEHDAVDSPFDLLMRGLGQQPTSMSKYCVGMWKLVPEMKFDAFLDAFHELARLQPAAMAISSRGIMAPTPSSNGDATLDQLSRNIGDKDR
jgi:hypothetical protein